MMLDKKSEEQENEDATLDENIICKQLKIKLPKINKNRYRVQTPQNSYIM